MVPPRSYTLLGRIVFDHWHHAFSSSHSHFINFIFNYLFFRGVCFFLNFVWNAQGRTPLGILESTSAYDVHFLFFAMLTFKLEAIIY